MTRRKTPPDKVDRKKRLDYSKLENFDVRRALVHEHRRLGRAPKSIVWDGHRISTADALVVPVTGRVRLTLSSYRQVFRQGVDIKCDDGGFRLADGRLVPLLRTWCDERFEDTVEYEFSAPQRRLWTWNVYERE